MVASREDSPEPFSERALVELAKKYVWWQAPEVSLARRQHFLCQLMTFATLDDMRAARRILGDGAFIEALEHAPPGVLDAKSWNYWHLFFGREVPPMPMRSLP